MKEPVRFEDALAQLEQIVRKLESGTDSLEEMVNMYDKGIELYQVCNARLDSFEKRIAEKSEGKQEDDT